MALTNGFSSEQFALRWNNFSYNLSSGFSSHLINKHLVDVTLAVEGQLLKAHKLILSVCSPYFETIFKSNPCEHPVVILQDMKYSEVDALVKFMYQGEISVAQEDLARFLKVAEVLKVKGLTLDTTTLQNPSGTSNLPQNSNETKKEELALNNSPTSKEHSNTTEQKKHKPSNNSLPKSSKRIKTSSTPLNNSTNKICCPKVSPQIDNDNYAADNNGSIISNNRSSVERSNNREPPSNEESIDLTQDDEEIDNDEISDNSDSLSAPIVDNSLQESPNIEPVTYRLSARGRPQLVHGGYVYNLTSRSALFNRSHYRCAEQHRGCRGKCAVIAERFMPTGVSNHNHVPCYHTEDDYRKKIHAKSSEDL